MKYRPSQPALAVLALLVLCGVFLGARSPRPVAADQTGSLSLSLPTPYQDRVLMARLSDPDGNVSGEMWQWSWSASRSGTFTNIANSDAATYTPGADDVGRYLKAHVTYTDADGSGKTAEAVSINVVRAAVVNAAPEFPVRSVSLHIDEGARGNDVVGATVLAIDADGDELTYEFVNRSQVTNDLIWFYVDFRWDRSSGELTVAPQAFPLNFERRQTYKVALRVRDLTDLDGNPSQEIDDTLEVTVNVNNVEEPGTVDLTSDSPGLRSFVEAQLKDPDGGIGSVTWQWSRATSRDAAYTDISGASSALYDIRDSDVGYYLKATASYDDAQGPGKSAEQNTTSPVPGAGPTRPIVPPIVPPIILPPTGIGGGGGGSSGPTPSGEDFEWTVKRDIEELDPGHGSPSGLWSDGTTLWVLENGDGADDAIYAYDLKSGERVEDREFELDERNRAPRGIWSDRTLIWVSDSGQEKLFAHDLAGGDRLPERDIALTERNGDARGIWSDDETMWVLDGGKDSLFGYDLVSGELLGEYELDSSNDDPHGIWSDGVSVWVSDDRAKRLFAYRLPAPGGPAEEEAEAVALTRVRDEEFSTLPRVSNNSPRGIWSDGEVMYVADASDDKVYSYNMPDAIDARLASLTLSGVDFGEFSALRYDYASDTIPDGNIATLTAMPAQPGGSLRIEPADHDGDPANGHHVRLLPGREIIVTVTSPDGSRTRVYRLVLGEEEAAGPAAACLRGAVNVGFSLVLYGGGSVDELEACAEGRQVTALYVPHRGEYVPYMLGVPAFVNAPFRELYPDGVPALTPLIAKSEGPPSADPAAGEEVTEPWPDCLRGELAAGFSLVLYEGGSVEELDACAQSRDVTALYALVEGEYVHYILGAPEFVNQPFQDLYTDGLPPIAPLVARSDGPSEAN